MSQPVRLIALKLCAVRLGIVCLVALGFGVAGLGIGRSPVGLIIGAALGAALSLRRAMRLNADDIRF